ncbi:phytanoyl-CoA dioxygenase family protein [Neolewinella xylanilytica]|uniref:phytanoyl-CoA dioxygenase family protein n=1 Tax=Neolewinella xylanilytica TaxID=1514080 RepID=UPI001B802781|nr:phytanoyl-CoA dioxygenase family protein [Neolewinella xylanilytica]
MRIDHAFGRELAEEGVDLLWKATQLDRSDPASWTEPVIRIGELAQPPFIKAANSSVLVQCYEDLLGDNWLPKTSLGSFPIRFPSTKASVDTGWHVDAGFPGDDSSDYLSWRINVYSRGRALLMLFLFSDTTEQDAPTRLIPKSHLQVANFLAGRGETGRTFLEVGEWAKSIDDRYIELATGSAGTVYLCHPFLVHAAQQHTGDKPKFMAQPALFPKREFALAGDVAYLCPVEQAIVAGIMHAG